MIMGIHTVLPDRGWDAFNASNFPRPTAVTSVAIVGAGFGGIGTAISLRRAGVEDITVLERGERVGGVWDRNTYPGAA